MKKLAFIALLTCFFIFSCKKDESNISILSYSLFKDNVEPFKLNISEKGSFVKFKYLHQIDSTKKLFLKHHLKKDFLISDLDTFYPIENIYNSKSFAFKIYQRKINKNHNRYLMFNENYGLLANLAIGSDFLFLKDSISKNDKKVLFKELFLQLNKINLKPL